MSLYRKYRPQNFDSLVGQDHVRTTLENALKLGRVNHAYLFTGPRGTGKTSAARILAKAVNCLNLKEAQPCGECEICKDIQDGRLIDLIEIDAASNRGIDEMRDLREKINFSPTRAKSKIYIIDEVHMLTKEAFNALLKTLEEPPSHVYFILATTEVHKIPETILSRCQRFDFKRISDRVIVDRLKFIAEQEKVEADLQALEAIAHIAQGGLRDAIGLMEQLITGNKLTYNHVCSILGLSGFASIEKLFGFLMQKDAKAALAEIHNLYVEGYDLTQFNKTFLEFLRKKMLQSVEDQKSGETAWLVKLVNLIQQAYDGARFATIPQLPLELAVIEACMEEQAAASPSARPIPAAAVIPAVEAKPRDHQGIKKTESQVGAQKPLNEPISVPGHKSPTENIIQNPQPTSNVDEITISKEEVAAKWPRILEHIKTPVVKRSFQESTLSGVEGHDVTLAFSTKFHLEKMMETANRVELENAFVEVIKAHVKIKGELKKFSSEISKDDLELAEKAAIFE